MRNCFQVLFLKVYQQQTSPMIVISFKGKKIIFGGLYEPSLRYLQYYKINPFDDNIDYFFTRSTTEHLDTISPLVLQTFARNKFLGITFHGPDGISEFINSMNYLVGIRYLLYGAYDMFSNIYKLGIQTSFRFIQFLTHQQYDRKFNLEESNSYIREHSDVKEIKDPSQTKNKDGGFTINPFTVYPLQQGNKKSVSYFVKCHHPEKFNDKKIYEDRFPLPYVPELQKYKEITIKEIKYKLEDYILPKTQSGIVILDLNHEEIKNFDSELLQIYAKDINLLLVIHLAHKEVLEQPEYEELIKKMNQIEVKTLHLITDDRYYDDRDSSLQRDTALFQHVQFTKKIHTFLPNFYPNPALINKDQQTNFDLLWKNIPIQKLLYKKTFGLQIDEESGISFEKAYKLGPTQIVFSQKEQMNLREQYKNVLQKTQNLNRINITFLGTSATVPSVYSNVQSFLISCDKLRILFDCGSNTFYQLFLNFGDKLQDTIQQIRLIFISHFHADHHLGLIQFIFQRITQCPDAEPLYIILPNNLKSWYEPKIAQLLHENKPNQNAEKFVRIIIRDEFQQFKQDETFQAPTNTKDLHKLLDDADLYLQIFSVFHCFFSSGLKIIEKQSGKSLVFSSDKDGRNNKESNTFFCRYTRDCDVLVHECTFPDTQIERAMQVFHSSFSQAIQTGIEIQAKTLVLTHYNPSSLQYLSRMINQEGVIDKQLYFQHLSNIKDHINKKQQTLFDYFQRRTVLANDLLNVNLSHLEHMPELSRLILKVSPNQ